ncbi:MAG: DUF512 domain-containing protein, partial [Actinomycetota bacterium]|nr:DUF512 domain-containing protein [Actinomycetota bacterium]
SACELIEQLEEWREEFGDAGPFASDEFFYLAGMRPPDARYYCGYPQLENGIGLSRFFLDALSKKRETKDLDEKTLIITTPMGKWVLGDLDLRDAKIEVLRNSLFGKYVTVCGLLPGKDIVRTLAMRNDVNRALVSAVAVSGDSFIDGMTSKEVSHLTGMDIEIVEANPNSLFQSLGGAR